MRLHPTAAAAAFALLVAPGCAPVRAEAPWGAPDEGYAVEEPYDPEPAPDADGYREELGPYGEWHDVPDYGVVWRPTYWPGWQPYADGYWAWTSYGWTWVSYEPWAWTLHYGRWAAVPAYGWVWVPGTVWGPAWVDWYWGDGYVGWAPLSPFGSVTVINHFTFVHEGDFCSRNIRRHAVHHRHLSDRVRRDWREREREHRRPPAHDRIQRVSRDAVTRLDGRPRETLAPDRRHDRRPARPGARPDLTSARRGWQERDEARGERREMERRVTSGPARRGGDDDTRRGTAARAREQAPRFDRDDADERMRRQPAVGGRGHFETRQDDRQPRPRQPHLDRDDGRLRPHAWGGSDHHVRRAPEAAGPRMGGADSRDSEAHRPSGGGQRGDRGARSSGGTRMGYAPGTR
jgi:hypothetical protein